MVAAAPWGLFFVLCAGLVAHALYYYPFLSDDALISLRYAHRLCEGQGLTWTDGERVEGYTNLLWVLLNAPATCLGASPIWSARIIGAVGALSAMLVVGLPLDGGPRPSVARLLGGSLCLALSPAVSVWAIGGLEHGFMTAPLAAALYFALRRRHVSLRDALLAGSCFAVLGLLRADGAVLFVTATLGRWAAARLRLDARVELAWAAPIVVALGAQLVFRLAYYGEWVPNTALAKVSFNEERLRLGITWVLSAWRSLALLLIAAVAATAMTIRRAPARRFVVPWAVFLGWSAYVAAVGGDIFLARRQMAPALVPLALLVAGGAETAAAWRLPRAGLAIIGWLGWSAASFWLQTSDRDTRAVKRGLAEWEGLPVGTALGRAFGEAEPLLAVDAAGALPFWSGLPALDMLGLNDHYLPRHPHPEFGHGPIGHELGDGEYVWRRKPDLIAFCGYRGSPTPCFRGGKQLVAKRDFLRAYQLVRVQGAEGGPAGDIYFRREDSRVGFRRTASRITIPGYFFAHGLAVARPEADGTLSARISTSSLGVLRGVPLPEGTWIAQPSPPDPKLRIQLRCARRARQVHGEGDPNAIEVEAGMAVDIVAAVRRATVGGARLRELSLVRSGMTARFRCRR